MHGGESLKAPRGVAEEVGRHNRPGRRALPVSIPVPVYILVTANASATRVRARPLRWLRGFCPLACCAFVLRLAHSRVQYRHRDRVPGGRSLCERFL